GVHAHAGPSDFTGGRLGQPDHRVFGGDIGRHAGGGDQARNGGRVHNRSASLLDHHRQHVAHSEEDASDIDGHDAVEQFLVILPRGRNISLDAGVVVEAVYGAV